MYNSETTGSLLRIRANTVLRYTSDGGPSTYRIEGDRSYANGVFNATGQYPLLPAQEFPVLPPIVEHKITEPNPAVESRATTVIGRHRLGERHSPRHRRIEKSDPWRRSVAAIAVGIIAAGSAMLYSQYQQLPEAWGHIASYFQ